MQRANLGDYRPVWLLAFYDQAELDALALSAHLALGDYPTAEFHAQLTQGDLGTATATAMKVPADAATRHPRVSRMLQEFGAALRAKAPGDPTVQTWTEHVHDAWRAAS